MEPKDFNWSHILLTLWDCFIVYNHRMTINENKNRNNHMYLWALLGLMFVLLDVGLVLPIILFMFGEVS